MLPTWVTPIGEYPGGQTLMNVPEQVAKLCQGLPPDKQEAVARTTGCLRHTRTSSEAFAQRKQDEKAHKERRWKA